MDKFVKKIKRSRENDDGEDEEKPDESKKKYLKPDTKSTICEWRRIRGENLNCDYTILYNKDEADELFTDCEKSLQYNVGQEAQVHVFGKWHDIPRKQAAHGDEGLAYTFSNKSVMARPWTPLLLKIRDHVTEVTGYRFNFVLINRYKDGNDHIGEHRDDERELEPKSPIASLTLGQARDFVLKHCDARGRNAKRKISPVKLELKHGSLLMMNYPTNVFWYHSLPPRKSAHNVRINMTFRKMDPSKIIPVTEKRKK